MPRYMIKAAFEFTLQSTEILNSILPDTSDTLVWKEFQDKLQAFYLFEHADLILNLPSAPSTDLAEMVRRTSSLGAFSAPWAMEGIGHYYTRLHSPSHVPAGLISRLSLPSESMIPLHTGMGLALAEMILARRQDPITTATNFIAICRDRARPALLGATLEALGLVVRNLYPELTLPLSQYFWQNHQEMFEYFWHGVGRGIYFTPLHFLPCWVSPWQGYEVCLQEAPNDLAKANAVAGYTWAATLVNLRQPAVIASLVQRHREHLAGNDAFANGVFSSLVIWLACAPGDTSVASLLSYQPPAADPALGQAWEKLVRKNVEAAAHFQPDSLGGPAALFRYRPVVLSK